MGLKQFTSTPGLSTARIFVAQVGGTVGNVTAATAKTLTTGVPQNFVADRSARYFYSIDGSGNLLVWDSNNPATPASVMVSQAALGDTPVFMDISLDSATLYLTTTGNRVLSVLTVAPHTVSILAGSGTNAHTNGTGTGASFAQPQGIAVDPANGLSLYVWNGASGGVDQVVIATGVVTTLFSGFTADQHNAISVGKDGRVYYPYWGGQAVGWHSLRGLAYGTLGSFPGLFTSAVAVDDDEPGPSNLYCAAATSTDLKRVHISTNTAEVVGSLQNPVDSNNDSYYKATACFRSPAVYQVDYTGNLLQFSN